MSETSIQITYGKGFDDLLAVFAGARRPGSWLATGSVEVPMPALEVEKVGMLSFPVPPAQARELIAKAATRAPYGKGGETLVDESVRKVWQIAADKISLRGKVWEAAFAGMVRQIGDDLGCEGVKVEAQLYKLLVYEKGGFFLPHRDSEKAGGMFGTLVVALPSAHTGGELIVRHAGHETVLELKPGTPSEIQYAAFYADCEHEVRPLTSGYRVCLIYNLVQTGRKRPLSPPDHETAIAQAVPLLVRWAESETGPDKIVHLLEHRYTMAALSLAGLKGADAALAQTLLPAAARAGCAAHLALVHIEESGSAEYSGGYRRRRWDDDEDAADDGEYVIGEVCDGRYYIDQWRTADDQPAEFGEIPIDDDELLPPGSLDGEPADESHFSEATGNAGASFDRTYLRAALVLWPHDRFDRICASAGPDAALARLEQLVQAAQSAPAEARPAAEDAARRMARTLPPLGDWNSVKGQRLSRLLTCLRRLGDPDFLEEIALPRLLEQFDGAENKPLLACIPLLGETRATALLGTLLRTRAPICIPAALDLWTMLAKARPQSRHLLEVTLARLLEAIAQAALPEPPWWKRRSRPGDLIQEDPPDEEQPLVPRSATVAAFLTALQASPCQAQLPEALRLLETRSEFFPPEKVLLPTLEEIAPAGEEFAELWAHCARHYLARSEHPPEPPHDWAQNVTLTPRTPLLRELEAFARDPVAQVHRFRARQELRLQLQRAIEEAALDMTHHTERTGSPQTLVCTKTRATHDRARRQHTRDLTDMRRLLALPPANLKSHAVLTQRMRQAVA